MILLFPSVVPQTTVILNSDRQNAVVAKMEDPLSGRAPEPLENVISKSVARPPPLTTTAGPWGQGGVWGAHVSRVLCAHCGPRALSSHLTPICLSVCPSMSGWRTPRLVDQVVEAFRGGAFSTPFSLEMLQL